MKAFSWGLRVKDAWRAWLLEFWPVLRQRLKQWSVMVAFVLAVMVLVLGFVPILFPVTILLGTLSVAGGGAWLWWEGRALRRPQGPTQVALIVLRPDGRELTPVAMRGARAVRLAAIGLLWNLLLYLVLGVHSWVCFVRSFDRELEPIRKAFRVIADQPVGAKKEAPR